MRLHVPANSPHTEHSLVQAYAVLYLIVSQINNLIWTASVASLITITALDKYAKSGVRGDPSLSYVDIDIDIDMDMAVDI